MRKAVTLLLRQLILLLLLCLAGGLIGATLVRFSPGYGVNERELDPRWNAASVAALRNQQIAGKGLFSYYRLYLAGLLRGDLGESESLKRPVRELLRQRLPVTAVSVLKALAVAWFAAFLLASFGLAYRGWLFAGSTSALSSLLLSVPSAVVAMFAVYLRVSAFWAIGLVVFPRIYRYVSSLMLRSYDQPHVLAARASGLRSATIFWHQVLPTATPPLLALLGVSFVVAFGAAIPIEALCDSPGLGQLAWQAALSRDLPLIVNVTLAVTVLIVAANSLSQFAGRAFAGNTP